MLIILLTGLSGAGKSTLAAALSESLEQNNYPAAIIDGDHYRRTLNADLGFSEADRRENIRRLMQVAQEKKRAGIISIIAAINPYEDQRRELMAAGGAIVVYVKCALDVLIERDTKGLYKKGLLPDGHPEKIYNLSGINDRYDVPAAPHLIIDSSVEPVAVSADRLFKFVYVLLQDLASE